MSRYRVDADDAWRDLAIVLAHPRYQDHSDVLERRAQLDRDRGGSG